jgi:hypothetical protein
MLASDLNSPKASQARVITLPCDQTNDSNVASSLMAFFSPSGEFRIETDFKTPQERAALVLHLELAIGHIRQVIDNESNRSWNLAARVAA